MRTRSFVAVLVPSLAIAACHRTEEPSARTSDAVGAASVASAGTVTRSALTGRCVAPTPERPPPAVGPAKSCPADPDPHMLGTAVVELPDANARFTAEIARSSAETERGLMYRTQMAEDHGMLFVFDEREVHSFWMRNTCIPLDMMFVDEDGLIVGILENVPTLNDEPRQVPCESQYVIEVNAGWSRRHGVRAGQKAKLPVM